MQQPGSGVSVQWTNAHAGGVDVESPHVEAVHVGEALAPRDHRVGHGGRADLGLPVVAGEIEAALPPVVGGHLGVGLFARERRPDPENHSVPPLDPPWSWGPLFRAAIDVIAEILPVIIRVRWRSASGPGLYEVKSLLGDY